MNICSTTRSSFGFDMLKPSGLKERVEFEEEDCGGLGHCECRDEEPDDAAVGRRVLRSRAIEGMAVLEELSDENRLDPRVAEDTEE